MKIIFEQLVKGYQANGERFVEVKTAEDALEAFNSTGSCSWGNGKMGETDWYKVGHISPAHKGMCATVLVCKASLIEPFYDRFSDYHKDRLKAQGQVLES